MVLRLPREVGPLFRDWLEAHYPDRAKRVMGLVRELHGGRDYDPQWGRRMKGEGVIADADRPPLRRRHGRLGLHRRLPPLRTDLFRVPERAGAAVAVLSGRSAPALACGTPSAQGRQLGSTSPAAKRAARRQASSVSPR